jgi:glutathione synthase/RimK-type ligase-like ATP-grasp enzyme
VISRDRSIVGLLLLACAENRCSGAEHSLRRGELLGLELYGVDLLETPDGLSVTEVNCFPGYKGVPGAARLLAGYTLDRVRSIA